MGRRNKIHLAETKLLGEDFHSFESRCDAAKSVICNLCKFDLLVFVIWPRYINMKTITAQDFL